MTRKEEDDDAMMAKMHAPFYSFSIPPTRRIPLWGGNFHCRGAIGSWMIGWGDKDKFMADISAFVPFVALGSFLVDNTFDIHTCFETWRKADSILILFIFMS